VGRRAQRLLGSRNGTWVDGVRVEGRERLGRLSVVTLAEEHDLLFQNLSECEERARAADLTPTEVPLSRGGGATEPRPAAGGGAAPEPAPKPAAAPRAAPPAGDTIIEPAPPPPMPGPNAPALPEPGAGVRVSLEVEGEAGPRVVPLEPGENVVGRVPGAQIQLDSTTVSRRHAVLTVRGENVRIRDEGSRNKTLLEGDPLEAGVERELRAGASIHFGTVAARLRIDD